MRVDTETTRGKVTRMGLKNWSKKKKLRNEVKQLRQDLSEADQIIDATDYQLTCVRSTLRDVQNACEDAEAAAQHNGFTAVQLAARLGEAMAATNWNANVIEDLLEQIEVRDIAGVAACSIADEAVTSLLAVVAERNELAELVSQADEGWGTLDRAARAVLKHIEDTADDNVVGLYVGSPDEEVFDELREAVFGSVDDEFGIELLAGLLPPDWFGGSLQAIDANTGADIGPPLTINDFRGELGLPPITGLFDGTVLLDSNNTSVGSGGQFVPPYCPHRTDIFGEPRNVFDPDWLPENDCID